MKKTIVYYILFLSFLYTGVDAVVIEGQSLLKMNTAICFASKNVFQPAYKNQQWYTEIPCSLSIDSADFFFLSHDCGTCMVYCPCELIGSVRPFFVFKKPIDSLLIAVPLNLKDTNSFTTIDSSENCFFHNDSTPCYLPSIASSNFLNGSCRKINWSLPLIAVTSLKKYVLITITITTAQSCDPDDHTQFGCSTYTQSIILHWFLQNNGTLNFSDITGIASEKDRHRNVVTSHNSFSASGNLFDMLGRKAPASEVLPKKTYGLSNLKLFISDKTNTVKILFMGK